MCLGRDFAREEQPEHALSDDLCASRSRREHFLAVRNRQAMEADSLFTNTNIDEVR